MANVKKCDHYGAIYENKTHEMAYWAKYNNIGCGKPMPVNTLEVNRSINRDVDCVKHIDLCPECMWQVLEEYFGVERPAPEPEKPGESTDTEGDISGETDEQTVQE